MTLLTKCCLTGIICYSLAFAASFQPAAELNTIKLAVMKRTQVNREKHEKTKIQRTNNGGKGRENGGKGRTLKIKV